jgi:hypothetical protein
MWPYINVQIQHIQDNISHSNTKFSSKKVEPLIRYYAIIYSLDFVYVCFVCSNAAFTIVRAHTDAVSARRTFCPRLTNCTHEYFDAISSSVFVNPPSGPTTIPTGGK